MWKKRTLIVTTAILMLLLPAVVSAEFANEVKLSAFDAAAGDLFGGSVSSSGDTVIVGARAVEIGSLSDIGSAYVFVRDPGTDTWALQTPLYKPAAERALNDRFGAAVSISGDTVVIGIPGDDDNGTQSGSAYVFVRDSGTGIWSTQQKLLASDGALDDGLGNSVSISGDTALVAASRYTPADTGAVYVFVRDPGTGIWAEAQILLPTAGSANFTNFGSSVFLEGDMAIVGATGDHAAATDSGAAYIFVRDPGTGSWSLEQKLQASDGAFLDGFGNAVCLNNGVAIVGSFQDDDNGTQSGSAYVFVRDPGTGIWTEQQKLLASDGGTFEDFGRSVSLVDDTAIVGANSAGVDSAGAAYVFLRDPGTGVWTEDQVIAASDGLRSDEFGQSVAVTSGRVIIGAEGAGISGATYGAVYIYTETTVVAAPDITVADSVAPTSDLDLDYGPVVELTSFDETVSITNDGNADLIIGNIATANPLAAPFSILNDTCSGQTLAPAAFCTFNVRFAPTMVAIYSDSFDIPSNDPDEDPVTVSVSGSGTAAPTPTPEITVSDAVAPNDDLQIPFGSVTEGSGTEQLVTIVNDGNAELLLGDVAVADALAAPFSILFDSCSGLTLTPTTNCTFSVRFAPTAIGSFNDSFDIPSDDADENPVTISVSGTGAALPLPDISATDTLAPADDLQLPFGNLTEGLTVDQTVTVTNNGSADLVLGMLATADPIVEPFSLQNDTCSGATLNPAASCTFDIRFAPMAVGSFGDSLDIPSNDPDEDPVTITLSGAGLSAASNNPPSQPILISPADGEIITPYSASVNLYWQPSSDPDGDPVSYDVYLCNDPDPVASCVADPVAFLPAAGSGDVLHASFVSGKVTAIGNRSYWVLTVIGVLVVIGMARRVRRNWQLLALLIFTGMLAVACGKGSSPASNTDITHSVAGLTPNTTFYWAVVAKDDQGDQTASANRSFITTNP